MVTLLGLLVATAAAFAITEHLKQIRSPVAGALVTKIFSPTCNCAQSTATISVRLRHPDRVTVIVEDSNRHPVATLARSRHVAARQSVPFVWNGKTDAGALAPDGSYRPEIKLANAHQTILFPTVDRIVVDTTVPKVLSASLTHGVFSPGGHRTIAIHYSFNEHAHAVVYLGQKQIIRGRHRHPRGVVKWAGKVDGAPVPAGTYALSIGALDLAGNETPVAARKHLTVVVRYIDLAHRRISTRAGAPFTVGVVTQAPKYTWRLGRLHGTAHGKLLRLHAPSQHGTYRLVVGEHGHTAVAVVKVRSR
jgi:hypothetical protein